MASLASSAVEVRPARESEIDRVTELWLAMYAYQREHGMLLTMRDDAGEIWKRQLAGRIDAPVSVVLVAEVAGQLAGFLAAQTKRLPAHLVTGKAKVGYISEMYVCPEYRRHRVGRALVDAAFAWFARADVESIELQVLVGSDVARAFWTSVGFQPELLQMRAWVPVNGEAGSGEDG
jgi:GNAT superfamily N-acetyltransferase